VEETIEAHSCEVRDAILDTTAALLAEHGLRSVTVSQIAFETGIGPARCTSASQALKRSWSPGTNVSSPITSSISSRSATKLATLLSGWKLCWSPPDVGTSSPEGVGWSS
jgi:hypothetical protein